MTQNLGLGLKSKNVLHKKWHFSIKDFPILKDPKAKKDQLAEILLYPHVIYHPKFQVYIKFGFVMWTKRVFPLNS